MADLVFDLELFRPGLTAPSVGSCAPSLHPTMASPAEALKPGLHGAAANLFGGSFAGNLLSAMCVLSASRSNSNELKLCYTIPPATYMLL